MLVSTTMISAGGLAAAVYREVVYLILALMLVGVHVASFPSGPSMGNACGGLHCRQQTGWLSIAAARLVANQCIWYSVI
jgi:hypothetical protein